MEAGSRLGPYEIISRIGAGGMGEVWRARDTRLERDVAVKVLPADFADDSTLRIRFEREAKIISQLSHPHICTLHDIGDDYIVMELLEGETLAERLQRGPMPPSEVARYGAQIAEALDKGHQNGVVHRDLKPANVMLTASGAKLLDFGLAKSSGIKLSPDADVTVQHPLTSRGMIVGTFHYMAPEQLDAGEADARTDIFALGAVLYEMTTGKRAFEGKTATSLIAAIITGDPCPIRDLQPLAPTALQHVIAKCLEKKPERRWQSAADVAEELRWINDTGSGVQPAVARTSHTRWPERLGWIAALLAVAAPGAWLQFRDAPQEARSLEVTIPLDGTGGINTFGGPPSFSPDGRLLAFVGSKDGQRLIWIRELETGTLRPVPHTEGASAPFWSPDGRYLAFTANGSIRKVLPGGRDPEVITSASLTGSGTWSRKGGIVFSAGSGAPLYRISSGGGTADLLLSPASIGAVHLLWPRFLPDGKRFIFFAEGNSLRKRNMAGLWVASLDPQKKPRFIVPADSGGSYVEPGWLLFARDGALRRLRVDSRSLFPRGEEVSIASAAVGDYWGGVFDAPDRGVLAFQPRTASPLSDLVLKTPDGEAIRTIGRGNFSSPNLSHDGRRVAVTVGDSKKAPVGADIWIFGVNDGSASRLTFEESHQVCPVWSPDDTAIAFSEGDVDSGVMVKRPGGKGESLLNLPGTDEFPTDWSADGAFLAVQRFGGGRSGDVVAVSVAKRTVTEIAATPADEGAAVFSPDGRWIAYQSDESGRLEVYVQPFPPNGSKYQVSRSGGRSPRWRHQETIAFVDGTNHLCVVRVDTAATLTASPPASSPVAVESQSEFLSEYDVDPEGNVLLNLVDSDRPAPLTLITNWTRRLETATKE